MRFRITLITVITVFAVSICLAGPPPPPTGSSGGSFACWPPPCVPIDGGISLLIAAGAIYGGRKLYSNQKEKNSL